MAGLVALSACSPSEIDGLKRQVEIVEKRGTAEEKCRIKQKLADAYLKDEDELSYELSKVDADLACNQALLDRLGSPASGSIEAEAAASVERELNGVSP